MMQSIRTGHLLSVLPALAAGIIGCGENGVTRAPLGKLAFVVQPSTVPAGLAITPAVQVMVQDAQGQPVTSSTASVSVAITSGTGTSGAVLGGTRTRAAVNGVATFNDLTIDKAGGGYTLSATSTGLTRATSAGFAVYPGVATVQVSPSLMMFFALGDSAALTAVARDAQGNVAPNVSLTWRSSDSGVVAVRSTGMAIAVSNGSATVYATVASVEGATVITVAQMVGSVIPDTATLIPDDTVRLMALDANGHAVARTITWSSLDTAVATVDTAGLVTAVANRLGPTIIQASTDGRSDSAEVSVVVQFATIAAGAGTCGLTNEEVAYCWGNRDYSYYRPNIVSRILRFTALSVGQHACGITGPAGYCWGLNNLGQLGNGSTTSSNTPVLIVGGHAFSMLSAGYLHTCGVEGQSAYCWGDNINGAVGDSTFVNRSSPTLVAGGLSFKLVSAGGGHSCAITTGDSVYCWGYLQASPNGWFSKLTPVPLGGGFAFTAVGARKFGANGQAGGGCGIVSGGSIYCWGPITDNPQPLPSSLTFASVTVGGEHACALTGAGAAYCWGANTYGQLGDGSTAPSIEPVAVSGGLVFVALSAGIDHTCGVTSSGAAYCWGNGGNGQLGDGNAYYSRPNPVHVLGSAP